MDAGVFNGRRLYTVLRLDYRFGCWLLHPQFRIMRCGSWASYSY